MTAAEARPCMWLVSFKAVRRGGLRVFCTVALPCGLVVFAGDPLLDRLRAMSYGQALRWAGAEPEKLALVAAVRGYRRGWTYHRLLDLREHAA